MTSVVSTNWPVSLSLMPCVREVIMFMLCRTHVKFSRNSILVDLIKLLANYLSVLYVTRIMLICNLCEWCLVFCLISIVHNLLKWGYLSGYNTNKYAWESIWWKPYYGERSAGTMFFGMVLSLNLKFDMFMFI
jgi:hypothetical protein